MKKIFAFIFAVFWFAVGFVQPVSAANLICPVEDCSLGTIITNVSRLVSPLAVLGFIGTVIYAGWVRMTAAGNPEKEGKSMKIAIGAAVGFAIIALAPLLVRLVANILGVKGF